jgi:hypothetical protein
MEWTFLGPFLETVVSSTNHYLRLAIAVCTKTTTPYIANFLMKRWALDRVDGLWRTNFLLSCAVKTLITVLKSRKLCKAREPDRGF